MNGDFIYDPDDPAYIGFSEEEWKTIREESIICEPPDAAWKEGWEAEGKFLADLDTDNRWNLGRWLDEGYKKVGEFAEYPTPGHPWGVSFYSYASRITGFAPGHLKDIRSTWSRWEEIAPSVRTDKLSWSHHRVLVNELEEVTEPILKEWVDKAVENEWSYGELQKAIRDGKSDPKPPKDTHTFEVEVPTQTWETLKRLGATQNGPEEVAKNVLVEHCDDPAVQRMAQVFEKHKKQETREARAKNGRKVARDYDPRGLQRL